MTVAESQAAVPQTRLRWYRLAPDRFVIGLLALESLLWASDRFQWFGFNHQKGWTVVIVLAAVSTTVLLMLLWFTVSAIFRLRFQFSIRSLLLLAIVVAIPSNWMAAEMKKARGVKRGHH